jgi:mono/diheme cytochrome c family protein
MAGGALGIAADQQRAHPLVWDAMEKTIDAKPGDGAAEFTFDVKNKSDHVVTITDVSTSCGCTVVEMPRTPWKLAPGESGSIGVTVDFGGKDGKVTKSVFVDSADGLQTLLVNVNIPVPDEAKRERNRQLTLANRQAVFHNDCASCHVAPIGTKTGVELFQAACGICHLSVHRASMVPELLTAREHRDAAYWRKWIGEGKEQTLMPAFAQERGGPLSPAQIDSLVEFALKQLPTEPRPKD